MGYKWKGANREWGMDSGREMDSETEVDSEREKERMSQNERERGGKAYMNEERRKVWLAGK